MCVFGPVWAVIGSLFCAVGALAGCAEAGGDSAMNPQAPSIASPARDGNIAIMEEYDAAVQKNTIEAFELFILLHPDHPYVALAQANIRRLGGSSGN